MLKNKKIGNKRGEIMKKVILMLIFLVFCIVGCNNSNNIQVTTNSNNQIYSKQNNDYGKISDLQNLYFDIIKECEKNKHISTKKINKLINSYSISNIDDSNNEKNISIDNEKIKIQYATNKDIEKVTYFNKNSYSEKKNFFTLEYQNIDNSEGKFLIEFRQNDLNKAEEILEKLDAEIIKFSLYKDFVNIAEDMNTNNNLKESDLQNSNYKLKKFDYDGFYKKTYDCYITISTLSDKNRILSLKMFYPNGDVAIQFGYKSKSSLVLIPLKDLNMQKNYAEKLNTFFEN